MKYASIAAVSLLALTACSSNTVKDTLGLDRAAPDEFRVVSRPPLYVPPQFNLRPPANSDVSPNQLAADKKAQALINGTETPGDANGSLKPNTAVTPVTASDTTTKGRTAKKSADYKSGDTSAESQFLKDAGADKADPNVRDVLTEEKYTVQEKKDEKPWYNILPSDADQKDPIVDAKKESQRIQSDENAGKPVTDGTTPVIKPVDHGILNGILGN